MGDLSDLCEGLDAECADELAKERQKRLEMRRIAKEKLSNKNVFKKDVKTPVSARKSTNKQDEESSRFTQFSVVKDPGSELECKAIVKGGTEEQ